MSPSSKSKSSNNCENPQSTNSLPENDHDSGVSVSGNLSQSSGSGCDADLTDVADGDNQNHEKKLEAAAKKEFKEVQSNAEHLAKFVILQTLGSKVKPANNVEETLLRCVKSMTTKHEIVFNGMMKRLKINEETAYTAFITIANEIFEGDKLIVNWGRIIALYAFGGQLALHCKDKKFNMCGERIPTYLGRYAKDVISTFVHKEGGWKKICEEFPPEDDIDNKVWKFLTWTAVGLGLASAATFLTSH